METPTDDILAEVRLSSLALLNALRDRDPGYLEFLERREGALALLKNLTLLPRHKPILEQCAALGEAARLEALRMRQDSTATLHRLESRWHFSRRLAADAGVPQPMLDVKA